MDAALRLMPGINDLRRPVVPLMYHAYLRISIVVGTKIKHYSLFLFVILFVRPDSVLSVLASCVLLDIDHFGVTFHWEGSFVNTWLP